MEEFMLRLLIGLFALCVASLPARSDVFTFKVRSLHPNAVQIKFYSQTRKGHQWPTTKLAWDLLDDEVHALSMTCNRGERICWGAWVKGSNRPEWGSGTGGTDSCKACCYICSNAEASGIVTLNVRIDGDRVIPTQTMSTAKPARPPKRVIID
jgi:hypothetical protein